MKTTTQFAATFFGLCAVTSAWAVGPTTEHYFGVGYYQQSTEFDTNVATIKTNLDTFMLRYGLFLNSYLGAELHGGYSMQKRSDDGQDRFENNLIYGAFVRGNYPIRSQNINVYGLAGFAHLKSTYSYVTTTTSQSYPVTKSGAAYGAGVELFGTPSTSLSIEWMKYLNATGFTSNGFVFGVTHHFLTSRLW